MSNKNLEKMFLDVKASVDNLLLQLKLWSLINDLREALEKAFTKQEKNKNVRTFTNAKNRQPPAKEGG